MSAEDLLHIEQYLKKWPEASQAICKHIAEAFKFHSLNFQSRQSLDVDESLPRLYIGSKNTPSLISKSICLRPSDKFHVQKGICERFNVPISLSSADTTCTKQWQYSLRETPTGELCLEICTILQPTEPFHMVETSFLIYRHINGISFVKGVMQLRGWVKMPAPEGKPAGRAGHVFTVMIPSEALDSDSTYQLPGPGADSHCRFSMIMRHYTEQDAKPLPQ